MWVCSWRDHDSASVFDYPNESFELLLWEETDKRKSLVLLKATELLHIEASSFIVPAPLMFLNVLWFNKTLRQRTLSPSAAQQQALLPEMHGTAVRCSGFLSFQQFLF